jgi:hypothetical protein
MKKILFDVCTQVDVCFKLAKITETGDSTHSKDQRENTISLWEEAVNLGLKDPNTKIIGTLAYVPLSERKKYLIRGTNGWMKLHETGVERPLIISDTLDLAETTRMYQTQKDFANAVYFEHRLNNPEHAFNRLTELVLETKTLTRQSEWYDDEVVSVRYIEEPVEVVFFGRKDLTEQAKAIFEQSLKASSLSTNNEVTTKLFPHLL